MCPSSYTPPSPSCRPHSARTAQHHQHASAVPTTRQPMRTPPLLNTNQPKPRYSAPFPPRLLPSPPGWTSHEVSPRIQDVRPTVCLAGMHAPPPRSEASSITICVFSAPGFRLLSASHLTTCFQLHSVATHFTPSLYDRGFCDINQKRRVPGIERVRSIDHSQRLSSARPPESTSEA